MQDKKISLLTIIPGIKGNKSVCTRCLLVCFFSSKQRENVKEKEDNTYIKMYMIGD